MALRERSKEGGGEGKNTNIKIQMGRREGTKGRKIGKEI